MIECSIRIFMIGVLSLFVPLSIIMDYLAEWNPSLKLAFGNCEALKYEDVRIVYKAQTFFDPRVLYILHDDFQPERDTEGNTEGNTFIYLNATHLELKKNHVLTIDYPYSSEQLCALISTYICKIKEWDEQMNLAIIGGDDAQKLLDLSEMHLKNPCVLLDSTFCCIAISSSITDEDLLYYDIKMHGIPSPETILTLSRHSKNRQFTFGNFESGLDYRIAKGPVHYPEIYVDIKVDDSIILALNMRFSRTPMTPGLLKTIGIFTDKLQSLYTLKQYKEINMGIISFNEYLFPRILRGDQEALNLAKNSDLFQRDYMIATSNSTSIRALARKITKTVTGTCMFNDEENFYIFVPIDLFKETSTYYIKNQEERLAKIGEIFSIKFGLSGPFQGSTTLVAACRQARRAFELQDKVFVRNSESKNLILYRDIAFVDIAICYCKDYPVYSFAPLSYIAMRENDIKFGTNYCAFVKTYILNGCSSTKTAQQLFLHKNTVIYRLEKIKARFNLDVSDIHEQFRFLIACSADEQMCRDAD